MSKIHLNAPVRNAICRSSRAKIPAHTDAFYLGVVGNSSTNVYICKSCIVDAVSILLKDYDSFEDLAEELTIRKLSDQ